MSSSSSKPILSSVQFPEIFEVALGEYTKKTEKDIKTDPLFAELQGCKSSDAVLKVLEEQALAFEQYRKGDWKVQLMDQLEPIVEILYRLSTKDELKEGIVSVRGNEIQLIILCGSLSFTLQIFPPAKAIFTGIGLLLAVCIPFSSRLCLPS
jgi:hypothetical protein